MESTTRTQPNAERIKIHMTVGEAIMAMAAGNPGCISVLTQAAKKVAAVDPDNLMGILGVLMALDMAGIYEDKVWMLHSDVCGRHIGRTLAAIRAWQLGIIDLNTLNHAIGNRGQGLDINDLVLKVQERLPGFRVDGGAPQ